MGLKREGCKRERERESVRARVCKMGNVDGTDPVKREKLMRQEKAGKVQISLVNEREHGISAQLEGASLGAHVHGEKAEAMAM